MKNSIVFKFIAIVLCAASLLGAVGSGLGIFAMTEQGLYDRTVEDAYDSWVEGYAEGLAQDLAHHYASINLGGANSQLTNSFYGDYWSNYVFNWGRMGYVIRDGEGNILQEQELYEEFTPKQMYTFMVDGSYMNVLSETPEEEYRQANSPTLEEVSTLTDGETTVYNAIPKGGSVEAYWLDISYSDGSGEGIGSPEEPLGNLVYDLDGRIRFLSESIYDSLGLSEGRFPIYICFRTWNDQLIYEATNPDGVLDGWSYDGSMTEMELRPMTVSAEVYDGIPPEGCVVGKVTYSYDGGSQSLAGSPFGYISYDDNGDVLFTCDYPGTVTYLDAPVTAITFYDENEELIYQANDPDGVGYFSVEDGILIFRSGSLAAAPEQEVYRFVSDKVPMLPSDGAEVWRVEYWDKLNDCIMGVTGTRAPIGNVFLNENGDVVFRCDGLFGGAFETAYLRLTDADGMVLFESYSQDVEIGEGAAVGQFTYDDNGEMFFTTDLSYIGNLTFTLSPIVDEAPAVEEPDSGETGMAEVQKEVEYLSSPGTNAKTLGTLKKGDIVEVLRTENAGSAQWALTTVGWIPVDALIWVEVPVAETAPETTEATEALEESVVPVVEAESAPEMTEATEALAETVIPTAEPETVPEETAVAVTIPEETDVYETVVAGSEVETYSYYDYTTGQRMYVEYVYEPMPEYTVEVQLASGAMRYEHEWVLLRLVYGYKKELPVILGISLLLFAVMAVYLCCAAGRKPGTKEIRPAGLNCIPLDLYLGLGIGGLALLTIGGVEGTQYLLQSNVNVGLLFGLLCAYAASLLFVGFCFACAAQFKTPGGYWWRHSVCGWCLRLLGRSWNLLMRFCQWLAVKWDDKLFPNLVKFFRGISKVLEVVLKQIWKWLVIAVHLLEKGTEWLGKKLNRFFSLLPVTWQWLLVGFILLLWLFIAVDSRSEGMLVVWVCVGLATVLYGAHCFGVLMESAKRMSKGDLDEKVDDKLMTGAFKDFAGELNSLADVAVVAAQKQLKSERMKTELITNVSHDIKTPLTSIINYVDLLQKPHTAEDQEKYLEVLDRQSQRLKKLIDDLMEMSKASTGNLAVDISRVDAVEAVNQALGEFADKLDKAQLYPVFRQPEEPVAMMADGRLVWRVMSNLLSNAVKYALPGTRLYVDLQKLDSKVIISMKNISREELNVNADELLERFVRGDASRNTEGSGLGLNIAQSLMELQKGQLQILVDGDLFKVTLIFPGA